MKDLSESERQRLQELRQKQHKYDRGTPEWDLYRKMIESLTSGKLPERPKPRNL